MTKSELRTTSAPIVCAALALLLAAGPVAATSPSFTLGPGSPTLVGIPAVPSDVLIPALPPLPGPQPPPVGGIPAAALGLLPGDVVTGLSYGLLPGGPGPGLQMLFSVDPAAAGVPFVPPPASVGCEAAGAQALGDVFVAQPFGPPLPLPNVRTLDGNGAPDACPPAAASPGLGLLEPSPDDVVSLEMCPASFVYSAGVLTAPVYLTLAPGSPTLIALGATSGTVLTVPPPFGPPAMFTPPVGLGLIAGPPGCGAPVCDQVDDIDLGFGAVLFSLAPGSPSLGLCGYAPGDVLVGAPGPCGAAIVAPGAALGLVPGDDVDALVVNYDTDTDFVVDPCDNCPAVANNDQVDGDGDGTGDVCDLCIGSPNLDFDLDGYCDSIDNCPVVSNPLQTNTDGDATGDACDPCPTDAADTCCPATPALCTGGFAKGIFMKKEAAGKEKLIAKFLKGPLINQTDFGNPLALGDTKYNLCIYDDTPTLVGEVVVDRAGQVTCSGGASTCWGALGGDPPAGKGYKFKDSDGTSDGIGKILLKGGPASAGKSKALLKGKGANIPGGVTAALTTTSSVTIQLRGDDAPPPGCWGVTLSTISKQTADFFKAK